MTGGRRSAGAGLLRLYPASWRDRYEAEVLAVLEQLELGPRARLDLLRGAVDARLHTGSRLPAVAALASGAMWTVAGVAVVGQPVPPDWPGYLVDILPLTVVAVVAGLVGIVGCWARRSDGSGRLGLSEPWSRSPATSVGRWPWPRQRLTSPKVKRRSRSRRSRWPAVCWSDSC